MNAILAHMIIYAKNAPITQPGQWDQMVNVNVMMVYGMTEKMQHVKLVMQIARLARDLI